MTLKTGAELAREWSSFGIIIYSARCAQVVKSSSHKSYTIPGQVMHASTITADTKMHRASASSGTCPQNQHYAQ